jgi:hypothetical protein
MNDLHREAIEGARCTRRAYVFTIVKASVLSAVVCGLVCCFAIATLFCSILCYAAVSGLTVLCGWFGNNISVSAPYIFGFGFLFSISSRIYRNSVSKSKALAYIPRAFQRIADRPPAETLVRGSSQPALGTTELLKAIPHPQPLNSNELLRVDVNGTQ